MSNEIKVTKKGALTEIVLDRSGRLNAITDPMFEALALALEEANDDKLVRCITITGAGGVFTAGGDLRDFISTPPLNIDAPVIKFMKAISSNSKILIAAVNGLAVGIGTTMLLHCDLVVASTDATFQLPFINIALVPEAASSLLLPQAIGHRRAMELFILGDTFDAHQAMTWGLVNRVVATDELPTTLHGIVDQVLAKPPNALYRLKQLVKLESRSTLMRINDECAAMVLQSKSVETNEAIASFLRKRR